MLRATKSRVIVEDLPQPFPSGLHLSLPMYKSGRARVVSVGPEASRDLIVNAKVLTKPLSQIATVVHEGKKYRVLDEKDVLGIVDYET